MNDRQIIRIFCLVVMLVITSCTNRDKKAKGVEAKVIKREPIEWLDLWMPHTNEDSLPRILLIGNSITRSYHRQVENLVKERVYVSRMSTSKSIGDPGLIKEIELVMSYQEFDLVHFNNGLHGFGYSEEEYRKSFLDMVNTIRNYAPNAKLIWASTTPQYEKGTMNLREQNDRIVHRNKIADELLAGSDITINDLYTLGANHPEFYENSDGIHPNKSGYAAYSSQVADHILSRISE